LKQIYLNYDTFEAFGTRSELEADIGIGLTMYTYTDQSLQARVSFMTRSDQRITEIIDDCKRRFYEQEFE
jgi:hypothetical protein